MSQESVPSSRPTVLVVDDEEDLRDIMRRMLERRGFQALVAGDCSSALQICQQHPQICQQHQPQLLKSSNSSY